MEITDKRKIVDEIGLSSVKPELELVNNVIPDLVSAASKVRSTVFQIIPVVLRDPVQVDWSVVEFNTNSEMIEARGGEVEIKTEGVYKLLGVMKIRRTGTGNILLAVQPKLNGAVFGNAFRVSVEAREDISTYVPIVIDLNLIAPQKGVITLEMKMDGVASAILEQFEATIMSTTSEGSNTASAEVSTYTNVSPVPTAIGGIKAGTTFDNKTITEVLDMLLYPYQNPSFTTFNVDGVSSINLEVGQVYPEGDKLFTWSTNNSSNISKIVLNGTETVNDGVEIVEVVSKVKDVVGTESFSIVGTNSNGQNFSRSIPLNWNYKRYWGTSSLTSLDDSDIIGFEGELAANKNKIVNYDCTGGKYFYMVYPSSWGDMSATKVGTLDWNDWVLVKRSVVNAQGITIPMNVYRSNNLLNGLVTVNWG